MFSLESKVLIRVDVIDRQQWLSTCPFLSPGIPFYKPRGGTGLHGTRANVFYGMGEDVGQVEAATPVWLDGSCNYVLGDDGVCVLPVHVRSRMTLDKSPVLIRVRTYFLRCCVESCWSADLSYGILARGASKGLKSWADKGMPRKMWRRR